MRPLSILMLLAASSWAWAGAVGDGGLGGRLDRAIDLVLKDADLPVAVKALKESAGVVALIKGDAPAKHISLEAKATPVRDILDALS